MTEPTPKSDPRLQGPERTTRPKLREEWETPQKIERGPSRSEAQPLSALALEYQDMARQEARADTKAGIIGAVSAVLAGVVSSALAVVVANVKPWGLWVVVPALLLAVSILMLVMTATNVLRQVRPVTNGLRYGDFDRIDGLRTMQPTDWYAHSLAGGGPILLEKFHHLRAAVTTVLLAVGLALLGGGVVLLLLLLRVGQ